MNGAGQFILVAAILAGVCTAWSLRGENLKEYFSTDKGKGILRGIVLVTVISVSLVVLFSIGGCVTGKVNNGASLYLGLDSVAGGSPQCLPGPDDRTTSNMGLKYYAYESKDGRFKTNFRYTHHSCAFNSDVDVYDAAGIELEYMLWERDR